MVVKLTQTCVNLKGCSFGALLLMILKLAPLAAVEPSEMLGNPALEARAHALSQQVRCPVCQGQSIDDSAALLAQSLRRFIRHEIQVGRTDEEIITLLRRRFGDGVMVTTPFDARTVILWFAPALFLIIFLLFLRLQPHR